MDNNFNTIPQEENLPINESPRPKRGAYIVTILSWMGCFIGVQFIGAFIYVVIGILSSIIFGTDFMDVWKTDHLFFACSLASAIFVPATCAFVVLSKKSPGQSFIKAFSEYTHIHKLKFSKCVNYISVGVFMAFISGLVVSLIATMFNNEDLLGSAANLQLSFWTGLSVLFLAPIGEELLMRCVVFDLLKKYQSTKRANISQGILFGFLHGVSLQTVYTAILGWIMGHEVQKNDNLTCSLMIHMGFNLGAGLNCIFPSLGDCAIYNIGILIVSFFGFVVFANMVIQNMKTRKEYA